MGQSSHGTIPQSTQSIQRQCTPTLACSHSISHTCTICAPEIEEKCIFTRMLVLVSSETILQIALHTHTHLCHMHAHMRARLIGISVDKNMFYTALNKLETGFTIRNKIMPNISHCKHNS